MYKCNPNVCWNHHVLDNPTQNVHKVWKLLKTHLSLPPPLMTSHWPLCSFFWTGWLHSSCSYMSALSCPVSPSLPPSPASALHCRICRQLTLHTRLVSISPLTCSTTADAAETGLVLPPPPNWRWQSSWWGARFFHWWRDAAPPQAPSLGWLLSPHSQSEAQAPLLAFNRPCGEGEMMCRCRWDTGELASGIQSTPESCLHPGPWVGPGQSVAWCSPFLCPRQ